MSDESCFICAIQEAYRSSPVEIIVILVIITALVAALVAYGISRSRRDSRERSRLAKRLYAERVGQLKLSGEQLTLLDRMKRYLKDPVEVHLLVTDEVSFNAAAGRMREREGTAAQDIAALRIALGFHLDRGDRAPHSSAAIPENAVVLIARNKYRRPRKAKVRTPRARSFEVEMVDDDARMPPGAAVDVYYQNDNGVFTFHTRVLSERGKCASLEHSEELKRYQKRKYYRKRVSLPVHVYPFDEDIVLLSKFTEIGGGGCSLFNPKGHFKVGENIELRFRPDDAEIRITGTVMRISQSGKLLHVNYEHIKEGLRDRIYNALFKPPKDEQEAMKRARAQTRASRPTPPAG
jgi:c-di-GMP-binding flagellar brake protein YcgR